jgi:hypothetical protein
VAVLRTFSKAYGLAGVRVGYGFADPEVVQAFESARSPFDVNSLAQAAALAALDDSEHLEATLAVTVEGRTRIEDFLKSEGCLLRYGWAGRWHGPGTAAPRRDRETLHSVGNAGPHSGQRRDLCRRRPVPGRSGHGLEE